jgi:AraC-like DNA-binding protein
MQEKYLINQFASAIIDGAMANGYSLEEIEDAVSREISLQQVVKHMLDLSPVSRPLQLRKPGSASVATLKTRNFTRLYLNIKSLMQDEFFGLTPTPCRPGTLIVMLELVLKSGTLRQALEHGFRYYQVVTDSITFELNEGQEVSSIAITRASPERDPLNFLSYWWILVLIRLSGWLIGESIPLRSAEFDHPRQAPHSEYDRLFGPGCRFQSEQTKVTFATGFLDQTLIRDTVDLQQLIESFDKHLDLGTGGPGASSALQERIKAHIWRHFSRSHEFLSMSQIAADQGISSQTLRRRLERENTSYRCIKEAIRREVVMKWLGNPDIPFSEIAARCGFAKANGLSRAVKAWTGMSPTEYRARAQTA